MIPNVGLMLGHRLQHQHQTNFLNGRGPGGVVSTAAFHARVPGSFLGLAGLKETKMYLPSSTQYCG